jgi:Competence protein CoiA-like family
MPLRCLDLTGWSIQSFDLTDEQWRTLELENRKSRSLRMPCCGSQVILKRSHLGTQFFAHKAIGSCVTAPETETHFQLKKTVVDTARANGWEAATEVSGNSPSGEQWTADVLAQKGKHKVAVEIQWSGQTNDETMRRQERYRQSGIRGLWLLRQPGFPITHDLPAVCIGGDLKDGFKALIPSGTHLCARDRVEPDRWHQILPMREFLAAVFTRRFRFGPLDDAGLVSIRSGTIECWRESCRARTRIITFVELAFGAHKYDFTIPTLGKHPELCSAVLGRLPPIRRSEKSSLASAGHRAAPT